MDLDKTLISLMLPDGDVYFAQVSFSPFIDLREGFTGVQVDSFICQP